MTDARPMTGVELADLRDDMIAPRYGVIEMDDALYRWGAQARNLLATLDAEHAARAAAEKERDAHNASRQRQICTQQEWHAEQDRDIIDHLKGCGITTFGVDAQPLEEFFPKHGTAQCVASIVYSLQCTLDDYAARLAKAEAALAREGGTDGKPQ